MARPALARAPASTNRKDSTCCVPDQAAPERRGLPAPGEEQLPLTGTIPARPGPLLRPCPAPTGTRARTREGGSPVGATSGRERHCAEPSILETTRLCLRQSLDKLRFKTELIVYAEQTLINLQTSNNLKIRPL